MSSKLKIAAFFLFFCLSCSKLISPYRNIEIAILNTDYAMIRFYNPDSTLRYSEPYDAEYDRGSNHFSFIKDGPVRIEIAAEVNQQVITIDTLIDYKGKFWWVVGF